MIAVTVMIVPLLFFFPYKLDKVKPDRFYMYRKTVNSDFSSFTSSRYKKR